MHLTCPQHHTFAGANAARTSQASGREDGRYKNSKLVVVRLFSIATIVLLILWSPDIPVEDLLSPPTYSKPHPGSEAVRSIIRASVLSGARAGCNSMGLLLAELEGSGLTPPDDGLSQELAPCWTVLLSAVSSQWRDEKTPNPGTAVRIEH